MRDIHIGKRVSEATGEEQPDTLRKTVRFGVHQRLQIQLTVALEYLASGETQDRPGYVLVQTSGHVDDDVQISALDTFYEMDGRMSRYIGEVLEWYRGEDARDLKRSELNELVEKLTCLDAFEEKIWKSDQKVVMEEKFNPKLVMDGKLMKNFVMDAQIDPKVVMDL